MGRLLRQRPSPAMIVALIALFVALGGSSYAVTKISTKNLRTGAVNSRVVKNNSLRSADVRRESLTGGDIKTDSIKNADIDNATLRANSADTAARATTANTAENANALGGVAAANFTQRTCTSQTGAVKGFARIAASDTFSNDLHDDRSREPLQLQRGDGRGAAAGHRRVRSQVQPVGCGACTRLRSR